MTTPKKPSAAVQAQIDAAVQAALATATTGLVTAASKPHAIEGLRSTWRKSAEHGKEQLFRFLRLLIVSAIPVVVSAVTAATVSGQHFDPKTLLALLVPVAETAYRQVFPALGAAAADSAPGVTIVPDQVGASSTPVDAPVDAAPAPVDSTPLPPAQMISGMGGVPTPPEGDAAP